MGILLDLSTLALREVVDEALQAVDMGSGAVAVANVFTARFTDHGQKLTAALQKANERA
jgi:hypothetical protein